MRRARSRDSGRLFRVHAAPGCARCGQALRARVCARCGRINHGHAAGRRYRWPAACFAVSVLCVCGLLPALAIVGVPYLIYAAIGFFASILTAHAHACLPRDGWVALRRRRRWSDDAVAAAVLCGAGGVSVVLWPPPPELPATTVLETARTYALVLNLLVLAAACLWVASAHRLGARLMVVSRPLRTELACTLGRMGIWASRAFGVFVCAMLLVPIALGMVSLVSGARVPVWAILFGTAGVGMLIAVVLLLVSMLGWAAEVLRRAFAPPCQTPAAPRA